MLCGNENFTKTGANLISLRHAASKQHEEFF
mgnify:CR=1 FL=1